MNNLNAREWKEAMKVLNISPQKKAANKKAELLKKWQQQQKKKNMSVLQKRFNFVMFH